MSIDKNEAGLYETQLGDHVYEFQKWGAEAALDTLFDLGVLMGKPLGSMVASGGLSAELNSPTLQSVITSLATNLQTNRSTVMGLFRRLASGTKVMCDGKSISSFDVHYKDRLPHLFQVVKANLEVQFGNFFSELPGLIPGVRRVQPASDKPSNPQTPASTA